jgi:hypothetical protein
VMESADGEDLRGGGHFRRASPDGSGARGEVAPAARNRPACGCGGEKKREHGEPREGDAFKDTTEP